MKSRVSRLLVAATLVIIAQGAWAQAKPWYVAAGLGASFPNDIDTTQAGLTLTAELDTGLFANVAIGRSFGNFRAEGEIDSNVNDLSTLSVPGIGGVSASGDVSTLAFMVNGFYDFSTGSKWKPYIGGGVGAANVSLNNISAVGFLLADDNQTVFAYQAKLGVAYEFNPAWEGTLGYRFFATEDATFVDSTGFSFSADGVQAHILELGFRFRF
jgi:opacity protein-like surface antigen